MASDKPWYKLEITLDAAKVDTLMKALQRLNDLTSEHSQPGELKTKVVMESFDELTLDSIRDQFELWLRNNRVGIDGKAVKHAPLVRPKAEPPPDAEQGRLFDFAPRRGPVNEGEGDDDDTDRPAIERVLAYSDRRTRR